MKQLIIILIILGIGFLIHSSVAQIDTVEKAVSSHKVEESIPSLSYPSSATELKEPVEINRIVSIDEVVDSISTERMLENIKYLAVEIGIRVAGTHEERLAGNYIFNELKSYGYLVETSVSFGLDNGRASVNIWAELGGEREDVILIGAHYDSKYPAPGANDNGSGVAVVLELARALVETIPPHTIMFAFFGAEEIIDGNRDHHHYGSRYMAGDENLRARLYSMTSIDMVGVGTELWIDNTGEADDGWRSWLAECGVEMGLEILTGERRAWSDHEAFENLEIPVAWVHWRYDSEYHKATDTADRIQPELLKITSELMVRALLGLDGDTIVSRRESQEIEFSFF